MTQAEIKSFADFWPHYLAEHSRAGTRRLHAAGTLTSTALAVALLASGRWRWLPLALATGYAAAWAGHFLIEHNHPATFSHPLWSIAADYKMVALMLTGKIKDEGQVMKDEG
ncbi:MAG TPA: DUF962 domain-containing protein [Pyrinomonadaceae bacterium]